MISTLKLSIGALGSIRQRLEETARLEAILAESVAWTCALSRQVAELRAQLEAEQARNGPRHCPACGRDLRHVNGRTE